jgi:transcriptional regulator with XRE-family HTH domain
VKDDEGRVLSRIVGQNVAAIRHARGYTVPELVRRLGERGYHLHPSSISRFENGARSATIDEVVALALVLDVDLVRLVIGLPDGPIPPCDQRLALARARAFAEAQGTNRPSRSAVTTPPKSLEPVMEVCPRCGASELRHDAEGMDAATVCPKCGWSAHYHVPVDVQDVHTRVG